MVFSRFFENLYRDSVALMQLSAKLAKLAGIEDASAQMATQANLELMRGAGLLEHLPDARPNDILLVLRGDEAAIDAALKAAEALLNEKAASESNSLEKKVFKNIRMAFSDSENTANLALISTPGDYAAAEAMKALSLGMNAMLFSDNVSIEDEIKLKQYAESRGLLVMGPDCGTAIIGGMPLAFANVVKPGNIGVIAASGTGLQQVTCLIDQYGGGITQAIGTGGHDLSEKVGGITMCTALKALAEDSASEIIVLVSKPPAESVADKVLKEAKASGKPVVICFLGADPKKVAASGPTFIAARTLEEAARLATDLALGLSFDVVRAKSEAAIDRSALKARAERLASGLSSGQKYLRGLYTGGTFCYESLLLLQDALPELQSNTPTAKLARVSDLWKSHGHTILDLGDDDFTRGRPHPMIDPSLRNDRIVKEAEDPDVAVLLLDFVLGYGSHESPAGVAEGFIQEARAAAARSGRKIIVVGHICGTDGDPQDFENEKAILEAAGVELLSSNAEAALLCRYILEHIGA